MRPKRDCVPSKTRWKGASPSPSSGSATLQIVCMLGGGWMVKVQSGKILISLEAFLKATKNVLLISCFVYKVVLLCGWKGINNKTWRGKSIAGSMQGRVLRRHNLSNVRLVQTFLEWYILAGF